jgi:hypothetical protein
MPEAPRFRVASGGNLLGVRGDGKGARPPPAAARTTSKCSPTDVITVAPRRPPGRGTVLPCRRHAQPEAGERRPARDTRPTRSPSRPARLELRRRVAQRAGRRSAASPAHGTAARAPSRARPCASQPALAHVVVGPLESKRFERRDSRAHISEGVGEHTTIGLPRSSYPTEPPSSSLSGMLTAPGRRYVGILGGRRRSTTSAPSSSGPSTSARLLLCAIGSSIRWPRGPHQP